MQEGHAGGPYWRGHAGALFNGRRGSASDFTQGGSCSRGHTAGVFMLQVLSRMERDRGIMLHDVEEV